MESVDDLCNIVRSCAGVDSGCAVCLCANIRSMASIKQYRNKTWRAIVRRTGFPPQSKTFDLKRDAEAWAAGVEAKMGVSSFDSLQLKQARVTTVRSIFERYLLEETSQMRGRNQAGTTRRIMRDAAFMPMLLNKVSLGLLKRSWTG